MLHAVIILYHFFNLFTKVRLNKKPDVSDVKIRGLHKISIIHKNTQIIL